MRRRHFTGVLLAGAFAVTLPLAAMSATADASARLATVVSQKPVKWTPNVSADAKVGQEGSGAACNATFFGSQTACQSEVYSTAYVHGDVIVAGAFTHTCPPGPLAKGLCAAKSQVTRDDIFAYKAGTGAIDPHFRPILNAGPVYSVIAGPSGQRLGLRGRRVLLGERGHAQGPGPAARQPRRDQGPGRRRHDRDRVHREGGRHWCAAWR